MNQSPYRELNAARAAGRLRIKVLGLGVDPLTWKPDLLTVCLVDADSFDEIFRDMCFINEEGQLLLGEENEQLVFDEGAVAAYVAEPKTTPVAKSCLQLAWRHRQALGIPDAG